MAKPKVKVARTYMLHPDVLRALEEKAEALIKVNGHRRGEEPNYTATLEEAIRRLDPAIVLRDQARELEQMAA